MSTPTTILIVNYNTRRFIELCIKSIIKNTVVPYKIIVVDNGSNDGSVEYLNSLGKSGTILLINRRATFSAVEHGKAIDHVLYNTRLITTPLVCTIDSDAFASKYGWLDEINNKRGDCFAAGYEHFRDNKFLHPACMLFDYSKLLKIGRPSFALTRKNGALVDTGIQVSEAALKAGETLVGIKNMNEIVPHRWCATRILKVNGDSKLDNLHTRSEFNTISDTWFMRPDVISIMQK